MKVHEPSQLADYVRDRKAAVQLGKALFWDMQAGSDGIQACATCHFHAGADGRTRNQINPDTNGGHRFADAGGRYGPNHTLSKGEFPLEGTHDVVGSQGIVDHAFVRIDAGKAAETGSIAPDSTFSLGHVDLRAVTPRNAPSVIDAVFNSREFWDGRAGSTFEVAIQRVEKGKTVKVTARLDHAALAVQATMPILSPVEMSYDGRTFPELGRKLLALRPLGKQRVAKDDSVLGPIAHTDLGLTKNYRELIEAAFLPALWDAPGLLADNFELFWGLAIQLYESTLVADETPFDRYCEEVARGKESNALDHIGNGHA
ncbi:MAG TPA: cytochrome-c peroxidase, partial [Planctomycetota bacterium]|nr:cytochrome-c peroxidase [Planctomycetota bacterium]